MEINVADTTVETPAVETAQNQEVQPDKGQEAEQTIPKKRFDEVYAQNKAREEENQRLMAALQAALQRDEPKPQPIAEPEVKFDEETTKVVEAIEKKILSRMQPYQHSAEAAKDMAERADFHSRYVAGGVVDGETASKIDYVVSQWRKAGIPGTRTDALYMLKGKELLEGKKVNQPGAEEVHVEAGGGRAPGRVSRRPANFDKLSGAKKADILADELGDIEF